MQATHQPQETVTDLRTESRALKGESRSSCQENDYARQGMASKYQTRREKDRFVTKEKDSQSWGKQVKDSDTELRCSSSAFHTIFALIYLVSLYSSAWKLHPCYLI